MTDLDDSLDKTHMNMGNKYVLNDCHRLLRIMKGHQYRKKHIRKRLNTTKFLTDWYIDGLMRFGLLYNFYLKNSFRSRYCYYELSKIGNLYVKKFNI